MSVSRLIAAALCVLPASALLAQQNFTNGVSISDTDLSTADLFVTSTSVLDGDVCIGNACASTETFDSDTLLKFSDTVVGVLFNDTSSAVNPDRDWRLLVNDSASIASGGLERFSIRDETAGTIPFTIRGAAPSDAFYVNEFGRVGFGTSLPLADLHIVAATAPKIRLEDAGGTPYIWDLAGTDDLFTIQDTTAATNPLVIEVGAPDFAINVASNGNVGIGTGTPDAPFELESPGTFSFFRISAADAAVNQSVDITFTGGPLGTGQLRYNIVDGDNQEMSLDANGNMVLDGTLTTTGPTCAGGCDRVFDDDFVLASIEDHASSMWQNRHLPAVGPTEPGTPVNLTEKMGNMLNELEHAHIYIEQLHSQIQAGAAKDVLRDRQIEDLLARLAVLEARP
jgi:hypothetical protein